ncbi:U6 snRNA phosphodiesterase [Pseudocercospora fuligena]|uniref:U6 snRNA phosphodiesterase n=1 Tax=Pseudocercospora fuligena TaxID=685502 RepID=A0A8H6VQG4_9PEZI|nr:U6 snRNA phosphodiesterase [Pseudocercospora fuligena]
MGLVDYSDSEEEDAAPKSKRRRLSNVRENALPPLPAGFRDLYSSTVRTSTQDDPALHGGRKRVTPHVAGNWPTHVYLDWSPTPKEYELLSNILGEIRKTSTSQNDVQSLLENDLGVQLPLHVSLSRPLALKTNQKDEFVSKLEKAIGEASVRAFEVQPLELVWHPNEHRTRWFLVLRLQRPAGDELKNLLKTCNGLAKSLDQPLLYAEGHNEDSNAFHVSIAWSLKPEGRKGADTGPSPQNVSAESLEKLKAFRVEFSDVKVRIGQDVRSVALRSSRKG